MLHLPESGVPIYIYINMKFFVRNVFLLPLDLFIHLFIYSVWTPRYLFHTMHIYFFSFSFSSKWSSISHWGLFQLVSTWVLWHNPSCELLLLLFSISLLSSTGRCTRLILYISCLSLRMSHSPRSPDSFYGRMALKPWSESWVCSGLLFFNPLFLFLFIKFSVPCPLVMGVSPKLVTLSSQ